MIASTSIHPSPSLFKWRSTRIDRWISDLTAYIPNANAHLWFILDLFPHMNETDLKILKSLCFSCLCNHESCLICATDNKKIYINLIGSLEPCSVNMEKSRRNYALEIKTKLKYEYEKTKYGILQVPLKHLGENR